MSHVLSPSSFNKYGLRLCFLGISQNLPSYSRRLCRRLVKHHKDLLEGPEELSKSVKEIALFNAMRTPGLSATRKREIERVLEGTTAFEAATEVSGRRPFASLPGFILFR